MKQAANWMGGPMPGVIGHLKNPSVPEVAELAGAAESAGARWLGLADAFWWRDVWILLTVAAGATNRLWLGPTMTNPYLRHPFLTLSALATLQELAGPRVFLGIAAGGSEARLAAKVDRRDAPARTAALIALLRAVAAGEPLDAESGRSLDVPLAPVPVLVAGGHDGMLRMAGRHADQALIWATADSELRRVGDVIRDGASSRADGGPDVVWAPLTVMPGDREADVADVAVYAVLNARREVLERWGLRGDALERIRSAVVAGDGDAARRLVPDGVLGELVLAGPDGDPSAVAARGREAGVTSIAVPVFSVATVESRVAWAAAVEDALGPSGSSEATVRS
jgi:5,10-methylenetetrahydromethanopterin reductase